MSWPDMVVEGAATSAQALGGLQRLGPSAPCAWQGKAFGLVYVPDVGPGLRAFWCHNWYRSWYQNWPKLVPESGPKLVPDLVPKQAKKVPDSAPKLVPNLAKIDTEIGPQTGTRFGTKMGHKSTILGTNDGPGLVPAVIRVFEKRGPSQAGVPKYKFGRATKCGPDSGATRIRPSPISNPAPQLVPNLAPSVFQVWSQFVSKYGTNLIPNVVPILAQVWYQFCAKCGTSFGTNVVPIWCRIWHQTGPESGPWSPYLARPGAHKWRPLGPAVRGLGLCLCDGHCACQFRWHASKHFAAKMVQRGCLGGAMPVNRALGLIWLHLTAPRRCHR